MFTPLERLADMRSMKIALPLGLLAALALAAPAGASTPTTLACGYRGTLEVSARPSQCFLDWPNLPLAEAVNLRQITWSSWGGQDATARAVFRVKTNEPFAHVTVRASGRRTCSDGRRFYTRVRVRFPRITHTWRMPGCNDIAPDAGVNQDS